MQRNKKNNKVETSEPPLGPLMSDLGLPELPRLPVLNINIPTPPMPKLEFRMPTLQSMTKNKNIKKLLDGINNDANELDCNLNYPLHTAAKKGDAKLVAQLINAGADVNVLNNLRHAPLHLATGNIETVKILLDHGALVNVKSLTGDTPLHTACRISYDVEILNLLIEKGGDVNAKNNNGETPLLLATMIENNLATVDLLIQNKALVNESDCNLNSPLHHAAKNGDHKVVKLLINAGARVNCVNKDERLTPLHYAVKKSKETVEILLNHGASVNANSSNNDTPLHIASNIENNVEIIALLIENGAEVNVKNKEGTTPLHYAAGRSNNLAVVNLLIENKANINEKNGKNKNGLSPLHMAAQLPDNNEVISLLVANGAEINIYDKDFDMPLNGTLSISLICKVRLVQNKYPGKQLNDVLIIDDLHEFKKDFDEIDNKYLVTGRALVDSGANLKDTLKKFNKGYNAALRSLFDNKPLLKLMNDQLKKETDPLKKINEKAQTSADIKEKEIAAQKLQKRNEKAALQKKQAEEAALAAAKPIHETIAQMFANTTIEFTYDETKKSYTFKFKTNDSYQAFKTIFKNHQQLKNTKLQFSGLSISFTEDEGKLKKAFKEDNNFISRLKDIIEKNIAQKEESPKTITQAEGEAEWDSAFKAHWQTYLKSIFPFDITVETNIDDLVLAVTFNQFNEKTKTLFTILNKFFDVNTGTGEATVILKDNKIIIKPLNKPSYNSYKDIAQPTFEKTSDLKALINKELNSNNITSSTTSHILGKTNTPQKTSNKKATNENNNAIVEPPKEEDKEAFKVKIKAFMNHISGNILTDKLDYFKITRINQNLSRIEMQFDVKAYSSFATNTTPTGSMEFLTKMKQAVNKVLGQDVMTFDEKENSIKFFFSKVDKAELFKKQDEIRKVFNELNTEVENEIKISDGKQEIKTDNNNADAATNNDVFTVNNLFNEIHQILARVKNNPEKNKNLLTLLKVLNNYSPSKNASDNVVFFHAYKLLATYTLNALSQEHYAENHLPHMYNLRSITRHAYDVYEWQDFHQLFSPFFKQLEEICIQIFNSTTDATPILFKQKNSLLPHVTSLNDELNLFAPLLTEGLLKGNLPTADINSFEAQIASLKADLNNNGLSEKTIQTIQFAILQFCCQIGESADKTKSLEKEIYGELHKPNLKNDPFEILNKLFQRYLFPASENKEVNASVNMKM